MSGAGAPDIFYKEAQRLGYGPHTAFKLLQIQNQHKLIKPGSSVLDLRCAPGAWLQVACKILGSLKNGGIVVGIDIKKVKVPSRYRDSSVRTVFADVMNLPKQQIRALSPQQRGFSVILSDMCPLVSGITARDASLSAELRMGPFDIAAGSAATLLEESKDPSLNENVGLLQPEGHLVIKLFKSEDVQEISRICKPIFWKTSWLRPKATRSSSREIYLISQGSHGWTCCNIYRTTVHSWYLVLEVEIIGG